MNSSWNNQTDISCDEVVNSEDQWSEDEPKIPAGVTDTMLTNSDFVEHSESQHILNVAPGEGSIPLSIFRDQCSEELAYPGIFLGQKKSEDKDRLVSVHYSDIGKSELRRSDRRAAMCEHILQNKETSNENSFREIANCTKKVQREQQINKCRTAET